MNKDRNHIYFWKYRWSWKWTVGLFLSRSRSSFPLDVLLRCSAFCSCSLKKDPKFLYFFVTATAFLTVLVRLVSLFQRHLWRICLVLIILLFVWFELLVSWNCPRARHQIVLSLVTWLPLGNIKAPKHPISVSVDKVKNLSFCWSSSNSVISEPNLMGFSILES